MQHSSGAIPVVAHSLPVTYTTQMIPAQSAPTVITTTAQVQEVHSTTNHVAGQTVSAVQLQEAEAPMESDKNAIYRHPLFPLMALLFEKCEQATQTPDCPTSDSFNVDIQSFVHHQEQDGKPFFSDDTELDNLMVKAIQVLRIHLLELEKVNELCKDFCHRYIACLKGKLQSENLLRNDLQGYDSPSPDGSMTSPPPGGGPVQIQTPMTPGVVTSVGGNVVFQQNVQQPSVSVATLNQGQIVSGGTVYQMVQTPQGLVAQPIQIQTAAPQIQTTPQVSTAHIIHGSTPLSQIGVSTTPVSTQTTTVTAATVPVSSMALAAMVDDDDDDILGKKKNKRGVLPKQATQVMRSWLFQHIVHPYPTEDEKRQIAGQTNLTLLQVNNWFINARRRILQPMLDASNPDQAKVKKNKTQNRPVQRFWPDSIANLQPQTQTQTQTTSSEPTATTDQQPVTAPTTTSTVHAAMTTVATAPQQIIIPAGAIVTADGQIINATGGPATMALGGATILGTGQQPGTHVIMVQNGAEQDSQIEPTDLTLDNSDSSVE